ncbi:cell division protein FtsE [Deinococcus radiopugnans]|uniref:Cell division protein FtsX n=3 Tax=Deinococcus radiopugnans TaxID=57497 RepID=A0A0A7KIX1_9DEIO|nr:ABC transporter permease [Deinococcus radiopugnans]AIZ46137.1 cell division protein FtsE [Deinococcus radiopugnans]MBB6018602.1 cell division protein FtsX [Deinococcus radiopugnans ATCC 19172]
MIYHLRQALLAMRGNFTATLATLVTMTLTLLMLGFVLLLTLNVNRTLGQLESQVEVAAFLTPEADTAGLLSQVRGLPQVREARLVSSAQVLEEMSQISPYTRDAAGLVGNPFPDTLRMKVSRVEDSRTVAAVVANLVGVDGVEYGAGYVDPTVKTLTAVRGAGYALVGLLLLGTLFNILNAVRVAMYARRDEISVMRLLGATRSFIRMPHVIEGLIVGVLAAALSLALLTPAYLGLAVRVRELAPVFPVVTDPGTLLPVLGGVAGLGILIGFLGSLFASRRYLRELE